MAEDFCDPSAGFGWCILFLSVGSGTQFGQSLSKAELIELGNLCGTGDESSCEKLLHLRSGALDTQQWSALFDAAPRATLFRVSRMHRDIDIRMNAASRWAKVSGCSEPPGRSKSDAHLLQSANTLLGNRLSNIYLDIDLALTAKTDTKPDDEIQRTTSDQIRSALSAALGFVNLTLTQHASPTSAELRIIVIGTPLYSNYKIVSPFAVGGPGSELWAGFEWRGYAYVVKKTPAMFDSAFSGILTPPERINEVTKYRDIYHIGAMAQALPRLVFPLLLSLKGQLGLFEIARRARNAWYWPEDVREDAINEITDDVLLERLINSSLLPENMAAFV